MDAIPLLLSCTLLCLCNGEWVDPMYEPDTPCDSSLLVLNNCECELRNNRTWLSINCYMFSPNSSSQSDILLQEIDALLANNTQLTIIDIWDARLTQFPMEICNLRSLVDLDMNYNSLSALPDCFSRLKQLAHFSAKSSRITHLQVYYSVCYYRFENETSI